MQYDDFRISMANGQCTVTVSVIFPTGGWSNPALNLVQHISPPADGVQELALSANAPLHDAVVTQAFSKWPFPVTITFDVPSWFTGVRISNADGSSGGGLMMASTDFAPFPL